MTARKLVAWLCLGLGLLGLGSRVLAQPVEPPPPPPVVPTETAPDPGDGYILLCPIDGMVDDGLAVLVERAVEESRGAKALVFMVDTPGGLVDAAIDITNDIQKARCPTVAYINGMGAISAGAMISFACDEMIITGEANIGAATPVIFSEGGSQVAGEKSVSFVRAKFRTLAELNGYNSSIAEAMVDPDIVLRARPLEGGGLDIYATRGDDDDGEDEEDAGDGSEVVLEKGKLLTLSANQTVEWGLILQVVNDLDEALVHFDLNGYERRYIEATWSEDLFRFLSSPTISGILMLLGIGGLYLEAQTPGFGFPGIIGIIALALFFGSHMLIGLASWLDVLLVIVGLGLLVVEVLVLPGFGVAGVAGIACLGMGLYMSLTRVTIPEYSWQYDELGDVAISLTITFVGLIAFALLTGWIFPKTPFYGHLVLETEEQAERGYVIKSADIISIGMKGTATTMLRPAGRGRFGDKSLQVVTRGDYLEPGTPIVIVQTDGNRYVVDQVKDA